MDVLHGGRSSNGELPYPWFKKKEPKQNKKSCIKRFKTNSNRSFGLNISIRHRFHADLTPNSPFFAPNGRTRETSVNHIRYATHIHHLTRPTVKNRRRRALKKTQNSAQQNCFAQRFKANSLVGFSFHLFFILAGLRVDSNEQPPPQKNNIDNKKRKRRGRFKRNLLAINHVLSRVRHLPGHKSA